jgi:hypothetical protein
MLRNTRSKLMRIIMTKFKSFIFRYVLNRQTNLKSMFSALSVK